MRAGCVFAWLAFTALRKARPQLRYALACLSLGACVLLPLVQFASALVGAAAGNAGIATIPLAVQDPVTTQVFDATSAFSGVSPAWIVVAWLAGVSVFAMRMALGLAWLRRVHAGNDMSTDAWQACVDRFARASGIRRAVTLRVVAEGNGPMTWGWWRPVVLLPACVVMRMPAPLVEALIAHEIAHVRRHDYLVNLLQCVAEALLFYHPAIWWLSHRIRVERELVADDLAADLLGERRRLAIALSELERLAASPSRAPAFRFAQAAQGGQLMARIRQLVRPDRQATGAGVALPLVVLAVAGIAFYAQARHAPVSVDARTQSPATAATPAVLAAPVASAHAAVLPMPTQVASPARAQSMRAPVHAAAANHDGYAVVRKGQDGFTMSGNTDDIDAVRAARRDIDGDFLWFRRGAQAFVVRDPALFARASGAWKASSALEDQMQALQARMQPHEDALQALSERMERLDPMAADTPDMREASQRMDALGREMDQLARQMDGLARTHAEAANAGNARADAAQRAELEQRMQQVQARMQREATTLQAHAGQSQAQAQAHEAIAREMEAAAKPMQPIGKEMEALGKKIEANAAVADAQMRRIIEESMQRGLALPAPARD